MGLPDLVYSGFLSPVNVTTMIENLNREMAAFENSGAISEVQKYRCTIRFLIRMDQYFSKKISDIDFLVALRDFILFVGRLQLTSTIAALVRSKGEDFGLYLEGPGHTVNSIVSRADWIQKEQFVKQVYGKSNFDYIKRYDTYGDAILFKTTNFKKYRSFEQKVAVHTALSLPSGHTLLVSLQTGAGKSLISQILSVVNDGLTVVIVPTVALGLDQYRSALQVLKRSITQEQVGCYCGDVANNESERIYNAITQGTLRLLITSPEAIVRNSRLKKVLLQAASEFKFKHLVIDEAHIVEDWGALFRPDFQMLSIIRRDLMRLSGGELKTILLSATITESAAESLKSLMCTEEKWIELRCDALRLEPRFIIEKSRDRLTLEKKIIQMCKVLPKPLIIYEIKPEEAEKWVDLLNYEGFKNIRTFTGDTKDADRVKIIEEWSADKLDIVVATSAFGMGIDKPDIRTIIHATIPENINRFYQEVGRGGRDGLPSLSVVCYCPHERDTMQNYIATSRVMTVENMIDRWFSMLEADITEYDGDSVLLDTSICPSHFTEEERKKSGNQNIRWNVNLLLFMIRCNYLDFQEMVYVASKKVFFIRVSMKNIDLLRNRIALEESLEPCREEELQNVMSGYLSMKDMVRNAEKVCCADYFVNIFPNASPTCGGCGSHENSYCSDGKYTFVHSVKYYMPNSIRLIEEDLQNILVVRGENESWNINQAMDLSIKLNTKGYNILVLPTKDDIDSTNFNGLVITADEFDHLSMKHPSLFAFSGVICAFDDNSTRNQKQYKCMQTIQEYNISYVYYCKENMAITQANRTIRHLLNAKTLTYSEV